MLLSNDAKCRTVPRLALIALAVCLMTTFVDTVANAQSDDGESLLDQKIEYDIITLKQNAGDESVKVYPIGFPGDVPPSNPDPEAELEVSLLIYPGRKYKVSWKDIEKVETFPQMIEAAAKKFLEDRDYANAFAHLAYLQERYPKLPNLKQTEQEFLLESAKGMFTDGELSHALAVLEEIRRSQPNLQPREIMSAISNVSTRLIEDYFTHDQLEVAQRMVTRLEKDYGTSIPAVAQWREKFRQLALQYKDEATKLMADKQYNAAVLKARQMLDIEPDLEGGRELLHQIDLAHLILRVGVFQDTKHPDPTALADWPARRVGSLVTRSLFEFQKTGPEGGQYEFVFGNFEISDDQTEMTLQFSRKALQDPATPNAYQIARWMVSKATPLDPYYNPAWASVFSRVDVDGDDFLRVKMRQSSVLPAAFLQWQLEELASKDSKVGDGLYKIDSDKAGTEVFAWNAQAEPIAGQPVDIIETTYKKPYDAIADLINHRIDVIDRIFPSDAKVLARDSRIKIEPYSLPIIHMLVPKSDHPYIQQLMFRRALLYAIDRGSILNGVIEGGESSPESQVISGPFPVGREGNDPLAYAYNSKVAPVAYDANLAKMLVLVTKDQLARIAEKTKVPAPEFNEIVLGVPDYEAARVAGEAFVNAWFRVDVKARVVVLDEANKDTPVDLLYVSAAVWEPAIDADRLLGEGAIAQSNDPYIIQALTNLRLARNWRQVRDACQDLHTLVDAHLPILPLWQIGESFAHSSELRGVPNRPVTLYQNIQSWRMER